MTSHLLIAASPLLVIAALILFQRSLAPILMAAGWLAAAIAGSQVGAQHFRTMLLNRRGGSPRWERPSFADGWSA